MHNCKQGPLGMTTAQTMLPKRESEKREFDEDDFSLPSKNEAVSELKF